MLLTGCYNHNFKYTLPGVYLKLLYLRSSISLAHFAYA
ncbi:MAG: hypothetical protein AVDCRST_MAG95-1183 [uncultured Adhaeribacter sp.]|uniref:Uncharacterized protein n=1 Tax=uncultured Adhaeribacter sp. TaxID=448109 RepID=A0A6J4HVS8_9BACT|nr:MAG: hypothetical protein AVDCRST_MAG95-1183 [uncultured Adhaeribacter sp.]